ncbi:hypothetical protein [Pseudobdellovibrio sp. HCB154]|uniref:hypothetical protein n=1 Tax=Pseudobdellovibrio sp. HCB154 TaxID=3386277 RepID=UPI003916FA6E
MANSKNLHNSASSDKIESENRREHKASIMVNGILFTRVVIDTHYEKKHKATMNDKIILGLIQALYGRSFLPETVSTSGFKYFVNDPWPLNDKWYRLIWLIPPDHSYIGILNAFRRKNGKTKK